MKKFYTFPLRAGIFALGALLLGSSASFAAPQKTRSAARPNEGTFTADGYYYEIISKDARTVRFGINFLDDQRPYSGDVVVPATVSSEGVEYSVIEIGPFAFDEDATLLKSVTLPESIRRIDQYSFWGTVIPEIVIPEGVEEIEKESFMEAQLETLSLPSTLTTVGSDVFCDNKKLKSVSMAEGMTTIGDNMFNGCALLAELSLPTTIRTIGEYAFFECDVLPTLTLSEGLEQIGKYAFARCNAFTEVTLPSTALTLGKGIFVSADNLRNVVLPEALTEIPAETFSYCTNILGYTIPDGITTVGQQAFEHCYNLADITFGSGVTTIGAGCFNYVTSLTSVASKAIVPPAGASFASEVYAGATLTVPASSVEAYRAAEGWKEFSSIIGNAEWSGIDSITGESAGATRWYNLQGAEVASPRHGDVLIRVAGGKSEKVVY